MLPHNTKEQTMDACKKGESQKHTKRNQTQECIPWDLLYMRFKKKQKETPERQISAI
jgi:hypothetical protein